MSVTIRPYRRGGWEVDIRVVTPDGTREFRVRKRAPVSSRSAAARWAEGRERVLFERLMKPPQDNAPPKEVPTRLEVERPHATAGGVIGARVVLDRRAPGFERAHGKRIAFEVRPGVGEHLVGVPVVVQDRIARMDSCHRVKAIRRGLGADIARRASFLAFADDITLSHVTPYGQ